MEIIEERKPEIEDKERLHTARIIEHFLKRGSDFILLGPPSSGKSTLVFSQIQREKLNFIKINCISAKNKAKILQTLHTELLELFSRDSEPNTKRKISKFNDFLDFWQDEKGLKGARICLVFDNFEKIDVSEHFFSQFLRLKRALTLKFALIFVGARIPANADVKDPELSQTPVIVLSQPSESFLKSVLCSIYHQKTEKISAEYPKFINKMVGDFADITRNIGVLSNAADILWYNRILQSKMDEAKRLLRENPRIGFEEHKRMMGELEGMVLEKNEQKKGNVMPGFVKKLKLVPSLILIACFLGNENPEKTDKFIFRTYRTKLSKKSVTVFREKKFKKESTKQGTSFLRLISLTESLMSVIEDAKEENKINIKKDNINLQNWDFYDHDLKFYSQISDLVEEGLIFKVNSKDLELTKTKFICNIEKSVIVALCEKFELNFQELCYFGDMAMD